MIDVCMSNKKYINIFWIKGEILAIAIIGKLVTLKQSAVDHDMFPSRMKKKI